MPLNTLQQLRCGSDFKLNSSGDRTRPRVTIVVPVFEGWPAVETCIESLLETAPANVPIQIIDDASSQGRLIDWLDELEQRFPGRLALIRNEYNKGYIATVNAALATLNGDVVVANSDTRFAPKWLEALIAVAGDPEVGIANPVSNNATIFSVPELEQVSRDVLTELLKTFWSRYFEIPTAVGFCMYLKREVLERYGGFDGLFDPGYGEECDYSMRLRRDGFKAVAVPASVVFHKGSCSFGKSGARLREAHDKLLSLRWPSYHRDVLEFARDNPVRGIREFLRSADSNTSTRVLHVLHELDYLGGVELFTKALLARFSSQTEHVVLCPGRVDEAWADVVETQLYHNVRVIRFDTRRYPHPDVVMGIPAGTRHRDLDQLFCRILTGGTFSCVHFHTLVRLGTLSWPLICMELEIPYILSMHELFHLCHDYNMVLGPENERYCGKTLCHEEDTNCLGCMGSRVMQLGQPLPKFIERRRKIWRVILHGAERLLTNGAVVSRSVTEAYGGSLRFSIREFEPYFYRKRHAIAPVDGSRRKPLHVAFLGAFSPRKGGEIFLAARRLLARAPVRWTVIGNVNSGLRVALEEADVELTGAYQKSDLDNLLADVDLVVQASIWPETYSITTSEAWERGRPVIAPDIGAFRGRIIHGYNGWLYPPGNAGALADRIERLSGQRGREELGEISQRLLQTTFRENPIARDLEALYAGFPRRWLLPTLDKFSPRKDVLPEPIGAESVMRKWLDQPMCLEAESDWEDPGTFFCLVEHSESKRVEGLEASISEHAPSAHLITLAQLAALPGDATVIVLQDGASLTANAGNWLSWWKKSGKPFGSCNYLLHDADHEAYFPVFRGRGDLTFLSRYPRRWAGLIAQVSRLEELLQRLPNGQIFDARLDRLIPTDRLAHYDGCALTMLDRKWSQLWKSEGTHGESQDAEGSLAMTAGVVMQGATGPGTRTLLTRLFDQRGVDIAGVTLLVPAGHPRADDPSLPGNFRFGTWDAQKPDTSINQAVRAMPPCDFIVFVADNVQLDEPSLLQTMIRQMVDYRISAMSPFMPSDRRDGRLLARRAGCGKRGLPGYGHTLVTQFDAVGTPHPADFLDDDLFIVDHAAWRKVGGMPRRGRVFYRAAMLSDRLRSAGFALARCARFVRKAALPSTALTADPNRLRRESEDVLHTLVRSRAPSVHSKSIALQPPYGLEYSKHAFKGGGQAPRLLAYAHDVWASGFYRVRSPAAALAASNQASCHFLPEQRERRVPNVLEVIQSGASVLLLHSFLHNEQLEKLADYRRLLDIPIIFSLDDWLIELPDYNPFSKTNYPDMARRVSYALQHCDRLIVPTSKLAEYYASFVSDIHVVPNRIPRALIRAPWVSEQGKLRVGWAGAPQHAGDLEWLVDVVRATDDHYQWVFFGQKPAGLSAEECEFHAAVPLKGYFEKLARLNLDVAVAPLGDNAFNRAKSSLKLLEYASLGLPVVCTDCEAYQGAPALKIENDPRSWSDSLLRLAEDPGARRGLAVLMRKWLEDEHVLEDHLDDWYRALFT